MADQTWQQLPFKEAIAFFGQKESVDTDSWREIVGTEWDATFAVAGAKADVLQYFQQAVESAIKDGTTLADFRKGFDQIVQASGWSYQGNRDWRSNLIYDTNLRSSYGAGRYEQLDRTKRTRPYWQWRHGGSSDPRPLHLALDGKVFPADSVFWSHLFPPAGYGCKCSVFSLSDSDLQRLGLEVEEPPEIGAEYQGQPVENDPGWTGRSGVRTPEEKQALIKAVRDRVAPQIGRAMEEELKGDRPTP